MYDSPCILTFYFVIRLRSPSIYMTKKYQRPRVGQNIFVSPSQNIRIKYVLRICMIFYQNPSMKDNECWTNVDLYYFLNRHFFLNVYNREIVLSESIPVNIHELCSQVWELYPHLTRSLHQ